MNQIAQAAALALSTCPTTSWEARPITDYTGQRLAFETMKGQLLDEASKARAKLYVMIVEWALTGKWPQFRNAPVCFLREIMKHAADKTSLPPEEDFPNTPPPWASKYVAHFLHQTALVWYSLQADAWARDIATEEFELQEDNFRQMNPVE